MGIAELIAFLAVLAGVAWLLWYSPLTRSGAGEPSGEGEPDASREGTTATHV